MDSHDYIGEQSLAHFESRLDGWRVEGEVVIRNVYDSYKHHMLILGGSDLGFLTTLNLNTDGKALSPQFSARDDQYLVFLVAGGGWDNVGLRLWADGEEVMVWRGQDSAQFAWTVYPLAAVADKRLQLELFDDEFRFYSHISLDHVMLARRIQQ